MSDESTLEQKADYSELLREMYRLTHEIQISDDPQLRTRLAEVKLELEKANLL